MSTQPTIIVHHLNDSRSQRVLWLLEELDVPYEIKFYQRNADRHAPKELRAIHPLGKSPVITDGDATLAESGAIVEYLIQKHGNGRFLPPKSGETTNVYFTHFAEGSFMPLVANKYVYGEAPNKTPFFVRPVLKIFFSMLEADRITQPLKGSLAYIEDTLAKSGDWFAGGLEPTAADFMMTYGLEFMHKLAPDALGPKTKAWMDRVHARPAYKRGLDKVGEA
ncbi:thioredoxin-like protein [Gloeopeniophorella convolvens]|nr:thioredoxin-like protein [Gloeopeniophorella convolvens]